MRETTFKALAELARVRTGQALSPSKAYLIDARVAHLVRREGFATIDHMAECLDTRPNPTFEAEIANSLLSRKTWFFRERDSIERVVQDVLPAKLRDSKTGRMKIWCAGGSTGQEAYSIGIRLAELETEASLRGARIDILSTDLCKRTVEQARAGLFGHYEVQRGLSIHRLLTHFQRLETGHWQISDALRERVSVRQHNLLEDAAPLGQFDVIFCRNVLSDMDISTRATVARQLADALVPDGVLMLGHGETLTGVTTAVQPSRTVRGGWHRAEALARTEAA